MGSLEGQVRNVSNKGKKRINLGWKKTMSLEWLEVTLQNWCELLSPDTNTFTSFYPFKNKCFLLNGGYQELGGRGLESYCLMDVEF